MKKEELERLVAEKFNFHVLIDMKYKTVEFVDGFHFEEWISMQEDPGVAGELLCEIDDFLSTF